MLSSRGRPTHLAVKPPRPPLKQCRSPRSEDELYDNTASTFSFPVTPFRLPPNADEGQWPMAGYPEALQGSPPFQRWVPTRRQRSVGTSSSKQLVQLPHAPSRHASGSVYPSADESLSLHGDLSVCIGLTVQCSPMIAATAYSNTPRHVTSRVVDPAAVVSWRNSHPMRIAPVRSCDDVPDHQTRWRDSEQADSFRYSPQELAKFRQSRRSHPPVAIVPAQPGPQRALGRDFRIPRSPGSPSAADWRTHSRGRSPFDDFAVGFENETSFVAEDLGEEVQQPPVLLDSYEEDTAFDEITEQIASLTQTVNDLRFKHRRPAGAAVQSEDSVHAHRGAVVRGGGARKQR